MPPVRVDCDNDKLCRDQIPQPLGKHLIAKSWQQFAQLRMRYGLG